MKTSSRRNVLPKKNGYLWYCVIYIQNILEETRKYNRHCIQIALSARQGNLFSMFWAIRQFQGWAMACKNTWENPGIFRRFE